MDALAIIILVNARTSLVENVQGLGILVMIVIFIMERNATDATNMDMYLIIAPSSCQRSTEETLRINTLSSRVKER